MIENVLFFKLFEQMWMCPSKNCSNQIHSTQKFLLLPQLLFLSSPNYPIIQLAYHTLNLQKHSSCALLYVINLLKSACLL